PERGEDRARRTLSAAEPHFEAGATTRAEALLSTLREELPSGRRRASVLHRLGVVKGEVENAPAAVALFEAALHEVEGDRRLEAEIHRDLAWMTMFATSLRHARIHAQRAVELSRDHPESPAVAEILAAAVVVDFSLGMGIRAELLERALALELGGGTASGEKLYLMRDLALLGSIALEVGAHADAAGHLRQARALADEIGFGEPALLRFVLDEVEALVALDRLEEAAAVLDCFER